MNKSALKGMVVTLLILVCLGAAFLAGTKLNGNKKSASSLEGKGYASGEEAMQAFAKAGMPAKIVLHQDGHNVLDGKLINGVPFYSRIWKTMSNGVSSEAYGMDQIQEFIKNHNMTVDWNAAACQNYAEVSEDDATYQIWIEDAESIEKKLEVMQAHKIIGVAEWCLGMESSDVWDVISEYMKN